MVDKVILKEENEREFWKYWQEYVEKNNVSPKYLRTYIEPFLVISKDKELLCSDKSFVLLENNEVSACVFLPIERESKDSEIKSIKIECDGDFALAPLFKATDKKLEKKIFDLVEKIARENRVSKIMFGIDPLEKDEHFYNYLQKYNYLDASILVYFVDTKPGKDLLLTCRDRFKRTIKSTLKNKDFSIFYIDKKNPDYEIHKEYEALHHKCSGRVTRPQWTFDNQFEELKNGNAVLFGLKYKGKNIAYYYFSYNGNKAISYSAADDPDYSKIPLYHALLFSAMKYFSEIGVDFIDMGHPSCPSAQLFYYPDEKQLNIGHFKHGFGGYFVEHFRGVKYFSKDIFEKDLNVFLKNYKEDIISSDSASLLENE